MEWNEPFENNSNTNLEPNIWATPNNDIEKDLNNLEIERNFQKWSNDLNNDLQNNNQKNSWEYAEKMEKTIENDMDKPIEDQIEETVSQKKINDKSTSKENQNPNININISDDFLLKNIKKQKVNWFFRTLVLIVLSFVWIALLLENFGILSLEYNGIGFNDYYPIIIIISTVVLYRYRGFLSRLISTLLFLVTIGLFGSICIYNNYSSNINENKNIIKENLKEKNWKIKFSLENFVWTNKIGYTNSSLILGNNLSNRDIIVKKWKDFVDINLEKHRDILNDIRSDLIIWLNQNRNFDIVSKNWRGSHIVDLSNLNWDNLNIKWWIWNINIIFWKNISGKKNVEVWSIFNNTTINIPKNTNVEINIKKLAWSIKLEWFEQIDKRNFKSTNINETKNSIKIKLNLWYSNFKVNWID
jgi:hypothetical protein